MSNNINNFSLSGIGSSVRYGKSNGIISFGTGGFGIYDSTGTVLGNLLLANATAPQHAVTQSQLYALVGSTALSGANGISFSNGTISALFDGSTVVLNGSGKLSVGTITDSNVASGANIALNKLAALATGSVLVSDSNGVISASSVSTTTLGYLDATSSIQTQFGSVQTALNAIGTTYLPLTGGTVTGPIISTAVPTLSSQLVNKSYVDALAAGIDAKQAVSTVSLTNITLSGLQTINGYTTLAGDRVLVAGQTSSVDNGIYVAASGAWARSTDMATGATADGAFTFVSEGTFAGKGYVVYSTNSVVGTNPVTWTQFSEAGAYTAGSGLSLNSAGVPQIFSIDLGTNSGLSVSTGPLVLNIASLAAGSTISSSDLIALSQAGSTVYTTVGSLATEIAGSAVTGTGAINVTSGVVSLLTDGEFTQTSGSLALGDITPTSLTTTGTATIGDTTINGDLNVNGPDGLVVSSDITATDGTFNGNLFVGNDLLVTGNISGSNLSGVNTGDQDLTPYALLSGATFTGAISAPNLSGTNTGDVFAGNGLSNSGGSFNVNVDGSTITNTGSLAVQVDNSTIIATGTGLSVNLLSAGGIGTFGSDGLILNILNLPGGTQALNGTMSMLVDDSGPKQYTLADLASFFADDGVTGTGAISVSSGTVLLTTDSEFLQSGGTLSLGNIRPTNIDTTGTIGINPGQFILFNGSADTNWRMGIAGSTGPTLNTMTVGSTSSLQIVVGEGTTGPDGFAIGNTGGTSYFEIDGATGLMTATNGSFLGAITAANFSGNSSGYNSGDQAAGSALSGSSVLNVNVDNTTIAINGSNQLYAINTGTGSVTSVAVAGSDGINVSGSPITNNGTISLSLGDITPTSIDSTGTMTLNGGTGASGYTATITSPGNGLLVQSNSSTHLDLISCTPNSNGMALAGIKSRGTIGSYTPVLTGDAGMNFQASFNVGTGSTITGALGAAIIAQVSTNYSGTGAACTSSLPVDLQFYTSANGGTVASQKMVLADNGGLLVGLPSSNSEGSGTINVSGGYYVNGTSVIAGLGTGSVTSITAGNGLAGGVIVNAGTLSLDFASLSTGTAISGTDLVALSQSGNVVSVTVDTLASAIVDASTPSTAIRASIGTSTNYAPIGNLPSVTGKAVYLNTATINIIGTFASSDAGSVARMILFVDTGSAEPDFSNPDSIIADSAAGDFDFLKVGIYQVQMDEATDWSGKTVAMRVWGTSGGNSTTPLTAGSARVTTRFDLV